METRKAQDLYQIIGMIRPLFSHLASAVEYELAGGGVSIAARRTMECLYVSPGIAVPEIAERLLVTRQSVQKVVNELLADKYVERYANPKHRRSALFRLSRSGRARFETIRAREQINLEKVARSLKASDIETCSHVIQQLTDSFADRLKWRGA